MFCKGSCNQGLQEHFHFLIFWLKHSMASKQRCKKGETPHAHCELWWWVSSVMSMLAAASPLISLGLLFCPHQPQAGPQAAQAHL